MTTTGHPETLMGWVGTGPVPAKLRDALAAAGPLPQTLPDAWREFEAIHAERAKRAAVGDTLPLAIQARYAVAVETLDTLSAPTLDDIYFRARWLRYCLGPDIAPRSIEKPRLVLDALLDDIEALQDASQHPAPTLNKTEHPAPKEPRPKTATERRTARAPKVPHVAKPPAPFEVRAQVLEILATEEGATLSNRAIARRLGCSPSSVASARGVA